VAYGHCKYECGWAYRFENLNHRNDELMDNLWAEEHGKKRQLNADKAGNFVIFSSVELEAKEIYLLYKTRCEIENCFDTAKNCLDADKMHMQDDAHVMGHLFITFLATSIRFEITKLLDEADLLDSYSPEDVLDVYATMKIITADTDIRQVVPKDVRDLDARLKVFMYSTQDDLDKLNGVKHKRGWKPKASGTS